MHWEIRGLEKLSFRERQVVTLKETGRSVDEVAKRLKLSPNSVTTLLARAKSKGYGIVCIVSEAELGLGGEDDSEEEDSES
ncbi:MAG: LuxR C-terminal-related transcriptional regulator [Peptococcaceae bacterium]|nr:LuxR C-terminal-related transcriptional regulator [Peptococcaceae bacterium]